ncbi:MAG: nucleoside triphosphate pyrophosphohydrolase [Faecalibacterium sp.]
MVAYPVKEQYTAEDLIRITAILRDPKDGCPWDKVQTHQSIRKNFLEETYEALEAIDENDSHLLCEELGDVLMQVALHACMEEEQGSFTFADVCTSVCTKLIGRHPHIFANASDIKTEDEGLNSWELIKNKEKGRANLADELTSVPKPLPALMKAQKTQKRAAPYQKITDTNAQAAQKLDEAYRNWQALTSQDKAQIASDASDSQTAAGELLFALVNQLRIAGVDAEEALSHANARFVAQALTDTQFSDAK